MREGGREGVTKGRRALYIIILNSVLWWLFILCSTYPGFQAGEGELDSCECT